MRVQVKVREFMDLVSLARHCACPLIHLIHLGVWVGVACARAPAVLGVSASASSFASAPASFALVAHARSTLMHDAHNSWSDTGRVQGPTGRRSSKGGVSGPAEDLRLVAEVAAGVKFRPAGGVREQVAGSLPRRQAGQGEVWSHLPSTRRFLTPDSRHLNVDWAPGNQWAGRRCVPLHGQGFGCLKG